MATVKVFKMNDCDWMAASSLEEAKKEYLQHYAGGMSSEEAFDCPHEVSDADMDRLQFTTDHEMPGGDGYMKRSFAEQLAHEIKSGQKFPAFFASTEF